MPFEIDRSLYARMYGPTTGDRVRLGDTNLLVEVERDEASPATRRSGASARRSATAMQMSGRAGRDSELDLIIGGALILDPVLGIFKGNIGIKDGRIVAIGRAGNPDIADDITVVSGANTGWIMGEGLIATPGIVDCHVHLATTSLIPAALSAGTTTIVGMGYGHVSDLGVNPAHNFHRLLEAWEAFPLNVQLLGRGSASDPSRDRAQSGDGLRRPQDPRGHGRLPDRRGHRADRRRAVRRAGLHPHRLPPGGRRDRGDASPPSTAAPSTPTTSRGSAAATRTSWSCAATTTSSAPPPPRRSRTPSTRLAEYPDMKAVVHRMHGFLDEDAVVAPAGAPGPGPSPPRRSCTTSAPSRWSPRTRRGWAGSARWSPGPGRWPTG